MKIKSLLLAACLTLFTALPRAQTVNQVANQTVCAGSSVSAITFSGDSANAVYHWTSSNTSIGLAASGTGNIVSFIAVNTGNTPVVDTITVTPVSPAWGYAYIPVSGVNEVYVLNTSTNAITDTINVSDFPFGVAASPNGSRVYITNENSDNVSVINTSTNTVISTISVGTRPIAVAVSPDGNTAYVANLGDNVSVINTSTNTVTGTIIVTEPSGLVVTPDGSKVYVANNGSNTISVINTATNAVTNTITVGNYPFGVAVSPDGLKVYVADAGFDTVSVISTTTNTVIASIIIGDGDEQPRCIAVSPDGSKVYVTAQQPNKVYVLNTASYLVTDSIILPLGQDAYGISISPDGNELLATNNTEIFAINTSTLAITNAITVGNGANYPFSVGNFIISGSGTPTTFTITVNAAPTVNPVSNQTVCAGDTTTTIHFTGTGTGTVYNWTSSNPNIGLAASGTGSIGSFTAVNTGNTPVVAQVTVTPVAAPAYAYIPNNGSDVSVINTETNLVTATIPVGANPVGVAISPDGSKVYISSQSPGGAISVISTAADTVIATINIGTSTNPWGVAFAPGGGTAYVANAGSDDVSIINTATNSITGTISIGSLSSPIGLAVSPEGSKLYVANSSNGGPGTVSVVSTTTNTVIATINVGSSPEGIAISPDGSKVYVANERSDYLSVISTSSNTVIDTISHLAGPFCVALSTDGSKLYVTNFDSNYVAIINTTTNLIIDTVHVVGHPWGLSISPDGSKVYIANSPSSVSVISTTLDVVTAIVNVGSGPTAFGNFITPGNGCTGTPTTFTITVNPQPTAGITGTVTACGTVSLTATGGTAYVWSGGSTPNTAANTFTTSNTYTVTVSNGGSCSATASKAVTVNTIPTATITPGGATTFCQGDSVILTASAGTTYLWSNTAITQDIHVKSTGSFTVEVGNANCSATSTATVVTVNALPNAAINGPTTICSGLQATLTASGGTGYSWSNGLGSNAQVNVSPTNNTTYTVTVSNANNCTATAQQTVSVTNTPTASISGVTEDCSGNGITLTANGGNTYSWAGGLGSNAAINVSPTNTTTYSVTATVGANCSATASQTITVYQPAASQFGQTICSGDSFNFNNQYFTQEGAYNETLQTIHGCDSIVTLNLTVNSILQTLLSDSICHGDSVIFKGQSFTTAGTYYDTLQSVTGCDSIVALALTIKSTNDTVNATAVHPAFCSGDSTQVCATSGFASYNWSNADTTACFYTGDANTYSVTVTDVHGCTAASNSIVISTYTPSPVTITASGDTVSSTGAAAYQWYFNSQPLPGDTGSVIIAQHTGNYTVETTDSNGCHYTSSAVEVNTGVNDVTMGEAITVFPNPASTVLYINALQKQDYKILLRDVTGQMVLQSYFTESAILNVADLARGIYLAEIFDRNNVLLGVKKVVLQ